MKPTCVLPSLSDILNCSAQQNYYSYKYQSQPYDSYKRQSSSHAKLKVSNLLLSTSSSDMIYEEEPIKAKRKRASTSQLNVLNKVFEQTFFPSTELRIELGKQLGMSPRTVQIWFQNKRQSIRTRERVNNTHIILTSPISPSTHRHSASSLSNKPPAYYQKKPAHISLPPLRLPQSSILPPTPLTSAQSSPTTFDHFIIRREY
ncbi:MAG: hypothetical protein EXX96DRAFT_109380 [Benjaminiella poitrasii]|nr:MAG: hypothetical protein EXX96DRAFT_109380 [Benjaminiella poitrasii]